MGHNDPWERDKQFAPGSHWDKERGRWVADPAPAKNSGDELERLLKETDSTFTGDGTVPSAWAQGPNCKHRGTEVKGVPGLLGSSFRGGLVMGRDANMLTVLLAREAAERIPDGWSSLTAAESNVGLMWWPISDMRTPPGDLATVKRFLYLHQFHKAGGTVEVACYGGHGRTGLVLAVLAALRMGWPADEAVSRLRDAYCHRAVESQSQVVYVERAVKACRAVLAGELPAQQQQVIEVPAEAEELNLQDGAEVTEHGEAGDDSVWVEGLGFVTREQRTAHMRDLRAQGLKLAAIGMRVHLSPNRVSEILSGK